MAVKVSGGGRPVTGSIERRGPAQWRASITLQNKKRVRQTLSKAIPMRQEEVLVQSLAMTLKDAMLARLKGLKPATRENQESPVNRLIKAHPWLVDMKIYDVNEIHIMSFIQERLFPDPLVGMPAVPEHWNEQRAKTFFREVDDRSKTGQEELLSVSHLTGVTPRSQKNVTMFKAASYVGSKLCQPGDIVINTLWAWMAALGASRHVGIVSPAYGVYRPHRADSFNPAYLDYLLRTRAYVAEYIGRSTGIRSSRLRLYPNQFLDIALLQPPRPEQDQIVAYPRRRGPDDRRCGRASQCAPG